MSDKATRCPKWVQNVTPVAIVCGIIAGLWFTLMHRRNGFEK